MPSYFHCFSVLVWKARRAKDIGIRYVWTRFAVFKIRRKTSSWNHNCFLQQYGILSRYPTEYFNNIDSLMNVKFPQTEEVKAINFPRFKY